MQTHKAPPGGNMSAITNVRLPARSARSSRKGWYLVGLGSGLGLHGSSQQYALFREQRMKQKGGVCLSLTSRANPATSTSVSATLYGERPTELNSTRPGQSSAAYSGSDTAAPTTPSHAPEYSSTLYRPALSTLSMSGLDVFIKSPEAIIAPYWSTPSKLALPRCSALRTAMLHIHSSAAPYL
jgi:hypothetical protein